MFSENVNAIFEDQVFTEKLATLESEDEVIAAFAEKGLDYEKDFASVVRKTHSPEGELDEQALENVSGGILPLLVAATMTGKCIESLAIRKKVLL